MADKTLTPANVILSSAAVCSVGIAGATITAGQPVYRDTADLDTYGQGKLKLADANVAAPVCTVAGIAAHGASAGQPLKFAVSDSAFTHGLTTVAAGDVLVLSATAGGIAPAADIASGMYPVVLLVATSATQGILSITNGTVAKA